MYTKVARNRLLTFAMTLITLALTSCGGGTTGTSSTDSVKFAGYAEQSDGNRAPFLSMTVVSGTSGEDLKDSGTNAQGDFSMALPATESSLVVDVAGVGSTTVQRQQRGAGTLSAKLSATEQGLVSGSQFEAQVSSSNLCPNLSAGGDELIVVGDDNITPCAVTFSVASRELSLDDFAGSVVAKCGDTLTTINTASSSVSGQLTLDLSAALTDECRDIRVVISHPKAPGVESTFSVR